MFAYPFGFYNDEVKELLRLAGYKGARTVFSTHCFDLPKDFLQWDPTCHHKDPELMALADRFVHAFSFAPQLFFVWGHGYEFDGDDNWEILENLLRFLHESADSIWFATNGEILRYVEAYHRLDYSADGSMVFNPSAVNVTILTARKPAVLAAGACTVLEDTPL